MTETNSQESPKSFFAQLPGAFAYPLRGHGKFLIIAGSVFFSLLALVRYVVTKLAMLTNPFWGGGIALIIGAVTAVIGCILPAYLLEVIARSAAGNDEPPDWPDVTNWYEDLIRPAFLVLGAAAVSFFPAAACRIALWNGWMHDWTAMWIFIAAGALYFPMALVGVALFDGAAGLNPLLVLPSAAKIVPAYLTASVLLAAVFVVWIAAGQFLRSSIPVIGHIVSGAVSIYLLMVEMRILGLMYRAYEKRLGWFE